MVLEATVVDDRRDELLFWEGLDALLAAACPSNEVLDEALRNYFDFTASYKDEYLQSEYDVAQCSYKLLDSKLFAGHKEYVRRQIIYGLLQEEDAAQLHLMAAFLLYDGKQNEATFEEMSNEEAFPRLLELIDKFGSPDAQEAALHRILLRLLYEMSRINRVKGQELMLVEDRFLVRLLQIIETLSDDVTDPYHYPVIQVLLVLNEQFMVCAHDPTPSQAGAESLPNKVISVLADYGFAFKTFGENIILLLNRESETSLQLLILKLLYLLFTTPATYEYFYTNDLRVLVDVVIRNLLDLPRSASALRHTYLRVLHPLLAHTQLAESENHYKREELLKVLTLLTGQGLEGTVTISSMVHFGATDETTKRLGARCAAVSWLKGNSEDEGQAQDAETTEAKIITIETDGEQSQILETITTETAAPDTTTANFQSKAGDKAKRLQIPKRPPPRKGSVAAKAKAQAQAQAQTSGEIDHPSGKHESAGYDSHLQDPKADSDIPPLKRPSPSIQTELPLLSKPASSAQQRAHASQSPSPTASPTNTRRARSAHRPTPSPPPPRKGSSAGRYLAIGVMNQSAAESSLSVAAVASPTAKPGVQTPSLKQERGRKKEQTLNNGDREERGTG